MKTRIEKGGKIIDEKDTYNNNHNNLNNLNNLNFNKNSLTGLFKDKENIENWNKIDKRNNLNSDILRLELMNLSCYSKKDINYIKGIDKFGIINKQRKAKSALNDLDYL
jgi:hypothetical protein